MHNIPMPLLKRLTKEDNNTLSTQVKNTNYEMLMHDIKQNIENSLNARKPYLEQLSQYPSLEKSILNYGLDDFTHSYFSNKTFQKKLCRDMEKMITRLESRLSNVVVTIAESDVSINRKLELIIEAKLCLSREEMYAVFRTKWEVINQKFLIE